MGKVGFFSFFFKPWNFRGLLDHDILESYWNRVGLMLLQLADVRYLVEFFTHGVLGP